jgi:hypothetical protein
MDPLEAFVETFSSSQDFDKAVSEAERACDETRRMVAKAGRATYVNQDDLKKADVPDPGKSPPDCESLATLYATNRKFCRRTRYRQNSRRHCSCS